MNNYITNISAPRFGQVFHVRDVGGDPHVTYHAAENLVKQLETQGIHARAVSCPPQKSTILMLQETAEAVQDIFQSGRTNKEPVLEDGRLVLTERHLALEDAFVGKMLGRDNENQGVDQWKEGIQSDPSLQELSREAVEGIISLDKFRIKMSQTAGAVNLQVNSNGTMSTMVESPTGLVPLLTSGEKIVTWQDIHDAMERQRIAREKPASDTYPEATREMLLKLHAREMEKVVKLKDRLEQ